MDRGEPPVRGGSPQLTCLVKTACACVVNLVNLTPGVDDFAARRGSLRSTAPGRSWSPAHTQRPRRQGTTTTPDLARTGACCISKAGVGMVMGLCTGTCPGGKEVRVNVVANASVEVTAAGNAPFPTIAELAREPARARS